MGGSVGKIAGDVGRGVSGVLTLGGSEIARNNLGTSNPLTQALGAPGTIFTGGASGQTQMPSIFGYSGQPNPYVGGPFSLDPNQVSADQSAITGLGKKQYDQTIGELPKVVGNAVMQQLPQIQEKLNSQHLLNSTALPQEIARQQEALTQSLAIPAMQQLQGTQTGALQRGLSLEDFINQANVSKSIGQAFTPQQPNGKQNFGTVAQGVGALSPFAKLGKTSAAGGVL